MKAEKSVLLRFILYGMVNCTFTYAVVTLVLAILGRGDAIQNVSVWRIPVYWSIVGGVGGLLWGIICGLQAIKWFAENAGSAEPWRMVVRRGSWYGIILGLCIAILSIIFRRWPLNEVNVGIRAVLYTCAGIWVGYTSSRAAWNSHVKAAYRNVSY
jgi:hypothetical protein